jgi:AcrR family transcriptional regulator
MYAMVTTDAPVARRTRPKDRREQILKAAFALIAEAGFNAVSLADIARACGIQKSSVLHHFPSMNDLLLGVLAMREEEDFAFYVESGDTAPTTDAVGARQRFTRVFLHNLERPQFVRLYSILSAEALSPEHPAHQFFRDRTRLARAEMARSLSWKADPVIAATELHAFWDGLELSWRHDPDVDVRAVWESFCDRFFA